MKTYQLSLLAFLLVPPAGFVLFAQQTAQAQTATISVAGAENDPMLVIVTRYSSGTCDLTCVLVDYSFCQEQTPGCLSGWAEIPNDKWKGNVGTSWTSGSVVTIGAVGGVALLPGDGVYGAAWYCEAWDDSGNCSGIRTITNRVLKVPRGVGSKLPQFQLGSGSRLVGDTVAESGLDWYSAAEPQALSPAGDEEDQMKTQDLLRGKEFRCYDEKALAHRSCVRADRVARVPHRSA
jgi:hypothetical protein